MNSFYIKEIKKMYIKKIQKFDRKMILKAIQINNMKAEK